MPKRACISASMAKRLMTTGRGKDDQYGATFYSLVNEVAAALCDYNIQRDLSGLPHIERGIEHEWLAVEAYQAEKMVSVAFTGDDQNYIVHPDFEYLGATPDGTIGTDGLLEVKNPDPKNHWLNITGDTQLKDYFPQLQFQLMVTGRKWVDWVSYDDDAPDWLKLHVVRVDRDDTYISEMLNRAVFAYSEAVKIADTVKESRGVK